MNGIESHKFLTPVNPVRHRLTRESKDKAIIQLASPFNYRLSPENRGKTEKLRRSKSVITPSKSRSTKVVKLTEIEKKLSHISIESDEDESSEDCLDLSESSESDFSSEESVEELVDPIVKSSIRRTKSYANARKSISVPSRSRLSVVCDPVAVTRGKLHVGSVPDDFPCRDNEFDNIYNFLFENLRRNASGCMFISGVPGTGKTATVSSAINCLQSEDLQLPPFKTVLVNGMHVTEPRQMYSLIYKDLTGRKVSLKNAVSALEKELFEGGHSKMSTVVLIDEIDQLCNKKQDVLYKIFGWLKHRGSRLVLITISNTMDLAERVLHNKVSSRLGVTRLSFEPYTPQQLVTIITARLSGSELKASFDPQAIELAARKVAAVSGDARRALDICRRAVELQPKGTRIDVASINAVIKEMHCAPKIIAIKHCCSFYEKLFLKAIVATFKSCGFEEAHLDQVLTHLISICNTENQRVPNNGEVFSILASLGSYKLVIYDSMKNDVRLKLRLMCSQQDVLYALDDC